MPLPIEKDALRKSAIHLERTSAPSKSFASTVTISQPYNNILPIRPNGGSSRRHDRCPAFRHVRRTARYRLDAMPALWPAGCAGTRQHLGRGVVTCPRCGHDWSARIRNGLPELPPAEDAFVHALSRKERP